MTMIDQIDTMDKNKKLRSSVFDPARASKDIFAGQVYRSASKSVYKQSNEFLSFRPQDGSMSMMRKQIKVKPPKKQDEDYDPFSARFKDSGIDITDANNISFHRLKTTKYIQKDEREGTTKFLGQIQEETKFGDGDGDEEYDEEEYDEEEEEEEDQGELYLTMQPIESLDIYMEPGR